MPDEENLYSLVVVEGGSHVKVPAPNGKFYAQQGTAAYALHEDGSFTELGGREVLYGADGSITLDFNEPLERGQRVSVWHPAPVQWSGVVDFNGWADRYDEDAQSVRRRTEDTVHTISQADHFHCHGEPGALTVTWLAYADPNRALARLFKVIGIEPGDFVHSEPPTIVQGS